MKPAVKNAVESALVSVAVALTILWFLVDAATAEYSGEDGTVKLLSLSLGLAAACLAHIYFLVQAAFHDGRGRVLWAVLLVVTFPLASFVLLAKLYFGATASAQTQS
ncbi:MAG: hypothetical protein JO006_18140 [Paucibacter sp.]|nr:hypothetical protein [Roseateles sp.]